MNARQYEQEEPAQRQNPVSRYLRKGMFAGAGALALMTAYGSYFTIDQTELGNVRRFGVVQYAKDQPVGPGFHLKLPFVDSVDKVQVTLQTLHIPPFDVLTVDNQKVTIEENFNYTIGKDQAYHVMYEVGRAGNIDIETQVIPVAHDRTARVFANQNMVTVNANREAVEAQIERDIKASVEQLFGINTHSLQIASIKPSDAFMASIDQATMAKNAAIAAENQLRTKEFEAKQAAATAKGQADAAIESARGQSEATILNAEANKTKLVKEGEGLQANLEAQIKPFGGADKYIDYMKAKAGLNWNGATPQIMAGNGASTNLIVPLPPVAGGFGQQPAAPAPRS